MEWWAYVWGTAGNRSTLPLTCYLVASVGLLYFLRFEHRLFAGVAPRFFPAAATLGFTGPRASGSRSGSPFLLSLFGKSQGRLSMDSARYDLFELPPSGFPRWISSAANLTEAKRQLEALPEPHVGGEYLVRDFWSGSVVAYRAPHLPAGMVVSPIQPKRRTGRQVLDR